MIRILLRKQLMEGIRIIDMKKVWTIFNKVQCSPILIDGIIYEELKSDPF